MATKKVDATLKVLGEIRDELRGTNQRLDGTNDRLDANVQRLDARIDDLRREVHEGNVRISTELVAVAKSVDDVKTLLLERVQNRDRIDDHERRLERLEKKVG
jgi:predicted RNase H-like nuclease (RuvC/YqgF family)